MIETDVIAAIAQLGAAGLIGWMWLTERRSAQERERQIAEAHAALMSDRQQLDILVRALESNTRAVTALETGQRELIRIIDRGSSSTPARATVAPTVQ
jgi:hypothetical protein